MRYVFIAGLLMLCIERSVSAQSATAWQLPAVESQKWAQRLGNFVGPQTWTISATGNEITLQRKQPVEFNAWVPNGPATIGEHKPTATAAGTGDVSYVVRFAPKISIDEYERLAQINDASQREETRLKQALGLSYKFDDIIASTPEEKQRLREYREAVAKLPQHDLPDFYTPDHSIYIHRSWHPWYSPADKAIGEELQDVEDDLCRYFGMYDASTARRGQFFFEYHAPAKAKP
jgi:hypothetical protein